VFSQDQLGSGLLLTRFLIGIPAGAVLGGWLAGRAGVRLTAATGLAIATVAFVQMSGWQANELSVRLGWFSYVDLVLGACGLGFGMVIAPLAAAVLDRTRAEQHGLASSLVVLARTMGMLIGLSVLTAFGLYRFHQILGTPNLTEPELHARLDHLARLVSAAFLQEYREIFMIAAGLCGVAGVIVLLTLGRGYGGVSFFPTTKR
jgi:MFS family permease